MVNDLMAILLIVVGSALMTGVMVIDQPLSGKRLFWTAFISGCLLLVGFNK